MGGGRTQEQSFKCFCLGSWETEDKADMFVTTSRLYKRHLSEYFCKLPSRTVLLELGVYHGHTTAVLAAMFQQVISIDIEKSYLRVAAAHTKHHSNIVFLTADLMVGNWQMFASSGIKVVVVDANHRYEYVRADAHNALFYLPEPRLSFGIFGCFTTIGFIRSLITCGFPKARDDFLGAL